MAKPRLTVILGPTASGKTDYGIQLAQRLQGEVVSADSRQVYRGMDVGTAKVQDMQGIPHHLIDIREPNQPLSLVEWQALAFDAIDEIISRGKLAILVGGTMLYVDSVIRNFQIPTVAPNPAFRAEKERSSVEDLYAELLAKDPEAKTFIEPRNVRRIIRALEVIEATGKPFSETRKRHDSQYEVEMIGLFPSRGWDELRKRIEARAKKMFEEGLLDEVTNLQEKYGADLPLLKTQNYRQAAQVLEGALTEAEAVADMTKADMRYARRQMSWWKGREEIIWNDPLTPRESHSVTLTGE